MRCETTAEGWSGKLGRAEWGDTRLQDIQEGMIDKGTGME